MIEANVYTTEGAKAGTVELPDAVFGVSWNDALVHQVVVSMEANARTPVAHAKDRSEVSGGGRKPWRQKGTGRARHGSIRSPIWRGGGVTHGPRNVKRFEKSVNRKMRTKALYTVLSQKLRDGEILFVDSLPLSEPKTAAAKKVISALASIAGYEQLGTKKRNTALIAMERDENAMKSFRNFGNIDVTEIRNLNPVSVLRHTFLVIVNPDMAIPALEARMSTGATDASERAESAATAATDT